MASFLLNHLAFHIQWPTRYLLCHLFYLMLLYQSVSPQQKTIVNESQPSTTRPPKILLFPYGHGYSSHIMDFQRIAAILFDAGYNVSVLINDEDRKHMESVNGHSLNVHSYPCCSGDSGRLRLTDSDFRDLILTQTNTSVIDFIILLSDQQINLCDQLLKSTSLLQEIQRENYDLLMVDFGDSCSRVVAQYFDIPLAIYSGTGLSFDSAFFPNLPTMVPTFTTNFLDEMTFSQRLENMLRLLCIRLLADPYYFDAFDDLKLKHGLDPSIPSVRKAFAGNILFAHTSWALDFPRPLLPTVIPIGGMHVAEGKPLEPNVASFIRKNGKHGLVLVSFGSLIDRTDTSTTEIIAAGLAQLKQAVIWRYNGEPPAALGANTMTMDWIPQNDLLANPITKVFISHCGIHGTYEAVQHAVPVVAVPLFADEFENANKLVRRVGMAVVLDSKALTPASIVDAVAEIINEPKYKENAVAMSRQLYDRPVPAKDTFLYYIDYAIRHRGAGPLASHPVINLDTLQLYGVDVISLMVASVLVLVSMVLILVVVLIRCCLKLCRRRGKVKPE